MAATRGGGGNNGACNGVGDGGTWPDLLRQSAGTHWAPIERELIGALYPPTRQWHKPFGSGSFSWAGLDDPHCDIWFLAVFPVAPSPPAPFQPSVANASLSDDPFDPPPAPPAPFILNLLLEPSYRSFACTDCHPTPPPDPSVFLRGYESTAPPPPPRDRFGSLLTGDCQACGIVLRGAAEPVIDADGQRVRLVHSVAPKAPAQRGFLWHHAKLPVAQGFELDFNLQFHRPSTCARPSQASSGASNVEMAGPRWFTRRTGCGDTGESATGRGALTEGAVGGEGLALVVHNDPSALDARGCAGVGVGYATDASHYSVCLDHIKPSVALQLSPHFNVTEKRRIGRQVAADEPSFLTWAESDHAAIFAHGDNDPTHALAARGFGAPGRKGQLIDGSKHHVRVVYTRRQLRVHFDHEPSPSLVTALDLAQEGIADGAGRSWIGFTAASGMTSIDADLLSFKFCSTPGCDA